MPKETVHDQAGMYDMQVSWAPDKYVQFGVQTSDNVPIVYRLVRDLTDEEKTAAGFAYPTDDDLSRFTGFTGLWGTLDRAGCNRLIRALRRARDQAYGADA